jgi:Terminase RNaseH-like domain
VGAAPPGSGRAGLEGILGRDGDESRALKEYGAEHSENGIEERGDPEGEKELGDLLDLGQRLDTITPKERWKRDKRTGEVIWKPTYRDNWIEENLKIRTKKTNRASALELNAAQREYSRVCWERKSKRDIVLKARQVGMTSYIAARLFVQTIVQRGTLTMLVAHDRMAAEEIFRIVHRFWDNLGDKLREGPLKTSHSSARELVFPRLDSGFCVASADENTGRGRTIQNLHCTEVSRWGREGEEALASLRAALVPDGEIVLESTANGAWGLFYNEWQRAAEEGYTRHFFPWWFEGSYVCEPGAGFEPTWEEADLAKRHGLTLPQLAWRRREWATLRGLAAQEFAEDDVECFRASGECVFELEVIGKALERAREPIAIRENGRIAIWLPPQAGNRYLIGVDPAGGGTRGDYSCAEVIDRKTGMQCAELHGHIPPREMADKVLELAQEYNDALVAVERNNHGHAVLMRLGETLDYANVYKERGVVPGWNTTVANRPPMIANLAEIVAEKPELFLSAKLWNECRTFVRAADGRPGAAPGAHDDCMLAMAIALAVRAEAGIAGLGTGNPTLTSQRTRR